MELKLIQIIGFGLIALYNFVLGVLNLRGIFLYGGRADGDPEAGDHKKCLVRAISYFLGTLYFIWLGFNFQFAMDHYGILLFSLFVIVALYYIISDRFTGSSDKKPE